MGGSRRKATKGARSGARVVERGAVFATVDSWILTMKAMMKITIK
jgi:hypothetical protein